MTQPPRPAFLYCRVSSDRQEAEGYSLPEQERKGAEHAAKLGATVARTFLEVESASSPGRVEFAAMCRELRRGRVRLVIAEARDRLYRNLEDYLKVEQLLALGVEFHLWREGEVLRSDQTASGQFTSGIKALVTKLYSDTIREKARGGMAGKARSGRWPTRAPLGYLNRAEPSGRRVVVLDPDRSRAVRELFTRCAAGESLATLRAWAAEIGLRRPGSSRPMSRSQIEAIIRQPFYMGEIVWGGEVFASLDPAMVSAVEWQAANDALTSRNQRGSGPRRHDFAYGHGLIACGCGCGADVVGDIKRRGRKVFTYYRSSRQAGPCEEGYIREELLEEQIREALESLRLAPDIHEGVAEAVKALQADKRKAEREELGRCRTEEERLKGRLARSYDAYLDGLVSADEHREAAARMRGDQARLSTRIQELERLGQDIDEAGIEALELARGAALVLPRIASPRTKRLLVGFFLEGLTLKAGRLSWAWRAPWDSLIRTPETLAQSVDPAAVRSWLPDQDRIRTLAHGLGVVPVGLRPVLELLRAA